MMIHHKLETPELLFVFASAFATASFVLLLASRYDLWKSLLPALLISLGVTAGVAWSQRGRR